jgi:hypothetical protein
MSVRLYSVFMLSCVDSRPGDGADHSSKESYQQFIIRSTVPD